MSSRIAQAEASLTREGRLEAELAHATAEARELRGMLELVDRARQTPISPPSWTVRPRKGGHAGIVVSQLADPHWDEVVRPEEIQWLNAYNRRIAERRLRVWSEKTITMPRDYIAGVRLEGLVILSTGDLFTGDIHDELRETNEAPLMASVIHWTEQMIASLDLLAAEYPAVAVFAVEGNHGRLTEKMTYKRRSLHNVEWLFWSALRARLADRGSKVEIHISPASELNVPLYGRNWLMDHGSDFKGGSGISGAIAPLLLGQHRVSVRQMAAGLPLYRMVVGHFHQRLDLPGLIVGGCLKGYDEYAAHKKFRPEEDGAGTMAWITTPEHGQTITFPILVQDAKAEGWAPKERA